MFDCDLKTDSVFYISRITASLANGCGTFVQQFAQFWSVRSVHTLTSGPSIWVHQGDVKKLHLVSQMILVITYLFFILYAGKSTSFS